MPESNLLEITAADEFGTTVAEPTPWLKSLPSDQQISKLSRYIDELNGEYDGASDEKEKSRIAILRRAAQKHIDALNDGRTGDASVGASP